jgi:alpha-D-xyloside xylohydrolase
VPPKSDFAHVTQLNTLQFLTAKSTRVDFAVDDTRLQLQIEAHAPGVYRLRIAQAPELLDEKPAMRSRQHAEMLLARHEAVGELAVSSIPEREQLGWRLEQGDIVLEITHSPLQFTLSRAGQCLVRSDPAQALSLTETADGKRVWRLGLDLDGDDSLYGLGETAGELDRRGQRVVADHPAQRALPLAWSTKGWGVYVNTLGRVEHDLGSEGSDVYAIRLHAKVLDVFLFAGDPAEILNQYTALTGRAGQPGLWPMGVWLDQAPGQSIQTTLEQVRQFRESGLGLDAVQLAAPAPYGFLEDKPTFEWDASRISNPRSVLSAFQEFAAQVVVPTHPGVLAGTGLFAEWEDRGWLLMNDDGSAHVFKGCAATADKPFGLLDLTYKDVYKLWFERQRMMFDEGVAAPVCDAQFDIPDGVTARGGETGAVLRAVYPLLARRALFDAVAGHKTPQDGIVLSGDLFPGVQRYAWQRGSAVDNSWAGFEQSLRMALSVGASAVPVRMHALGNYAASTASMTPELYIRWLAASVFSANFSFQGLPALLPGAFDAKTQALVQHWLQWRYRLVPYVLGIIEDAARSGLPVQRSMALAFPGDPVAHVWDTQYMLGPAVLVAPVLAQGTTVKVYLPEGDAWWDLNTGWRYEGGTTWTVQAGLDTLPVFGREGHMLCLGPVAQNTGEFNSARLLDEVWMFGMPEHSPVVMRNKIRVMQMQGSSYIKGLEGLRILPSEGLEVKRRGAEVRISRAR